MAPGGELRKPCSSNRVWVALAGKAYQADVRPGDTAHGEVFKEFSFF